MSAATTLFQLIGDRNTMFDGSVNGITILKSVNAKVLPRDRGVALDKGSIDIARHGDLDNLQSFTIEATITPADVGGARQNIIESQTPSIAFFIESNGKLVGSVHTAAGWVTVDSGETLTKAGAVQHVTFTRDSNGNTEIGIDGKNVGKGTVPGPLQNVGGLASESVSAWTGRAFRLRAPSRVSAYVKASSLSSSSHSKCRPRSAWRRW